MPKPQTLMYPFTLSSPPLLQAKPSQSFLVSAKMFCKIMGAHVLIPGFVWRCDRCIGVLGFAMCSLSAEFDIHLALALEFSRSEGISEDSSSMYSSSMYERALGLRVLFLYEGSVITRAHTANAKTFFRIDRLLRFEKSLGP